MSLKVSENGGGNNIPILEEGSYAAVCYMLVDIGLQHNERYNNSSRKIIIGWEIAGEYVDVDGEKKPRVFSARYTASLNEKAILRRDLAAWRGREFTEAELSEFNLRNIVGAPCLIQIIHKEGNNGKTYANLASIMKLPKGMPSPKLTLDPVIYDIDESPIQEVDNLPEWIANAVKSSESYQQRLRNESGGAASVPDFAEISEEDGELPF